MLANPARHRSDMANVFEATFQVRLLDGDGRTLARGSRHGDMRHGLLGHVRRVSIPYTVARAGWGTLQVFEFSAADGSEVNLTEYPVWLTP